MAHQGEDVDVDPMAPADMGVDPNPYVRCIVISDSGRIEEGKEWERAWLCQDDVMYDQGTEPFCWALSTAQVMAYRHSIIWCAPIIHYSAQEVMNSVRPFAEEAYTLILERAFEFILYNKISELTDVPFLGKKDVCAARAPAQSDRALGIVGYYSADFPSEDVLIAFLSHGPVVVGIISSPEFELLVGVDNGNIYQGALEFEKYVFHNCFTTHAVVLVGDGYDPNKGQSYWLIKNSVGQNWGKKGFGKIVKDCSIPDRYRGKTIISACIPIFNHESERRFVDELSRIDGVKFYSREE